MSLIQGTKMESVSVDAISSFQDEMLAKILSFLPTKQAASTSVLSKRWRNLFPLMNLLFESQHHYCFDDSELLYPQEKGKRKIRNNRFRDFVDKTLSGGNSSSIKKFSLKCKDDQLLSDFVDRWIYKALELGVVDFELRLKRDANHLPTSILTNKTLVKLTLGLEFFEDTIRLEKVYLPVLKSLVLHTNWFLGTFLYDVMLPGCPILEELALHYKRRYTLPRPPAKDVWISHKTLKRLTIHDHNGTNDCGFKIFHTPSLVYFDYSGFAHLIFYSTTGFTGSLVEAKLDFRMLDYYFSLLYVHTIIEGMRNVKSLSLSSSSVEMMLRSKREFPLFKNLVKLSFESKREEDWKMLPRLLNKSPELETLVLRGLHCVGNQGICIDPNEVKVLEIYGFRGSHEEVRQVKCLLSQMQFLQVMKVEINANAADKLRFITSDLLAPPKPSSDFQILFL